MRARFKLIWLVFVAGLVLVTTQSHAISEPERLFQANWADHLPGWCLYTKLLPDQSGGLYTDHPLYRDQQQALRNRFGPTYSHIHHYCFGLEKSFEAASIEDETLRKSKYMHAVEEFDYVLSRAPDDFVLKPEIFVQKGAALEVAGDTIGAVESYSEAVRLKGDYEPAYIGLSNCFEALGDTQQAITVIEVGLRWVPDSEILLARREELATRASSQP